MTSSAPTDHSLFIQSVLNANKTDYVSPEDIQKILKNINIPASKPLVNKILSELDLSKDGVVTKQEFITYQERKEAELRSVFDSIDVNRDGLLDYVEIEKAVEMLHLKVTKEQIVDLIEKMDYSKDKLISYGEFRDFIFLMPAHSIACVFDSWMKASSIDIGESITVPDEIKSSKKNETAIIFLSGGIAGAISRTATAPLDRLKVILQASQGSNSPGIIQGLKDIYKEGGARAFFRGNGTNVIKIVPETSSKFIFYERVKDLTCKNAKKPTSFERFTSGGIAGALAQSLIYPLEITKTRLALAPPGYYNGILDCIKKIYKKEGFFQLYKGLGASLSGIIPYAAIDLAIYTSLRDLYIEKYAVQPSNMAVLYCGSISSICGQVVSYPLALIRTKLQSQGLPGRKQEFNGLFDCARKILKNDGFFGYYRGMIPNFLKSVPAVAISYSVYENCQTNFKKVLN